MTETRTVGETITLTGAPVRGAPVWAAYAEGPPPPARPPGALLLPGVPEYVQRDRHSCGFLAALTAAHYFDPSLPAGRVLDAVRPRESGCDWRRVTRGLARLGVRTSYHSRLGRRSLLRLIRAGRPVLVTVWVRELDADHWAVVRGIDPNRWGVYLTNYTRAAGEGGVPWDDFAAVWAPRGGGWVCSRADGP